MYVGTLATATAPSSTTSTTLTATRPAKIGQTIVIAVASGATASNDNAFTGSDTRSNTYTEQAHRFRSGTSQISILTCVVTTNIVTGDVITIGHGTQGAQLWAVWAGIFDDPTGIDTPATVTTDGGSATSLTIGPSATVAQPSQLVLAAWVFSGDVTATFQPGWEGAQVKSGTSSWRSVAVAWQYANASGTRSAQVTIGASSVWAACLIALNAPVQPQVARPDADVSGSGTVIPSGSAAAAVADDDPATTVRMASGAPQEFSLPSINTPGSMSAVKVTIEARYLSGTSGSVVLKIREGATTRATSSAITVSGVLDRYVWTLTAGEAGAITDWSNLTLRVEPTAA